MHRESSPPLRAVFVGAEALWPADLIEAVGRDGYALESVADLSLVPSQLSAAVRAVFVPAGPLSACDLLVVRRVRELAPRTALVVFTSTPTSPDLKRAFEAGATAFLSWPASDEALRHAIDSGDRPASPRTRARHAANGGEGRRRDDR